MPPAPPETAARQLATRRNLTEIAARQARPATTANFAVALGTALVLWPTVPTPHILLWLLFMLAVGVIRLRASARVTTASADLMTLDRQTVLMVHLEVARFLATAFRFR